MLMFRPEPGQPHGVKVRGVKGSPAVTSAGCQFRRELSRTFGGQTTFVMTIGGTSTNMVRLIRLIVAALVLACTALAQTPGATASMSGRVLSEEGRTLRATVTLSFAAARGYPAPPWRTLTGTNGTFTFSRLPAGSYVLCAQVAATEAAPANSPYVDTCVWPSAQPPITLAAGQQVAGIVFTATKGALLKLRVADPDHVLPQAAANGPTPLEPELQLILKGPDGLYRHARYVSSDSVGRTYQTTIPVRTAVGVKIASTVANAFDQGGNQIQERDEVAFQPATAADLTPVTFTLHRK